METAYFDALPGWVTVQDRELRIVAANRRFTETFAGGVGSFCYQAYKRRKAKCDSCPVEATFIDGRPHSSEEHIRHRNGDRAWIMVRTSPVLDAGGRVVAVVEVAMDVSEVRQQERWAKTLFEEAPCYTSVQDRELRIIAANRRFRQDFVEPGHGHCYEGYKHRAERCPICPVVSTFLDGESHSSEEVVTTRDGRQISILTYTSPLRDPSGEISSVIEMSTDITLVRQLQSQLASLGLVVGSISHGIKGLLNGLGGGIYLVETGFKKDDLKRIQDGWGMLQRNLDRVRSMMLNLLYYAKDREMQIEPVDAHSLVADVIGMQSTRAQQLTVNLRAEADGSPGAFQADRSAMHSLLVNLVENSLDACRTDKKKEKHEVVVSTGRDCGDMVFQVSDNGIGMDQETREKAFSAFFSSKGTEGTGLGLFIAHKIATSHKGSIAIESTLHVGTRFTVRIPVGEGPEQAHGESHPGE